MNLYGISKYRMKSRMSLANIISFDDWKLNHDLLYGIGILDNDYLIQTAKNAMELRGMKMTRDAVKKFQEENCLLDSVSHNAGVIDINTFVLLVSIFYDYDDGYELMKPVLEEVNKQIEKYGDILNK